MNDVRRIAFGLIVAMLGATASATVTVDLATEVGRIKPMNAVGDGPVMGRPDGDDAEDTGNGELFRALEIPFCRTHDSNSCMIYGSPYIVDVTAVFPDFDADENDPKSYRFKCTDVFLGNMLKVGSKPFYRLGQTFNFTMDKSSVQPPKDFAKWARICEHIVKHYNEGWAEGFKWGIEYWEIWNEPDCFPGPKASSTWGGTGEQFDRFYEIAAKHLKATCPGIRVGGPALAWNEDWARRFLDHQKAADAPLDFFSWHIYTSKPENVTNKAVRIRGYLDERGFAKTESILNEWNYNRSFTSGFANTTRLRKGGKGAAFAAAVMSDCQRTPVDMLMYYDARPVSWNGVFDGKDPLKTYWAFWNWRELVRRGIEVKSFVDDGSDMHVVAAKGPEGTFAVMVTRFNEDDNVDYDRDVDIRLAGGSWDGIRVYMTDEEMMHSSPCPFAVNGDTLKVKMRPRSIAFAEK